jgi:hypothetical protein
MQEPFIDIITERSGDVFSDSEHIRRQRVKISYQQLFAFAKNLKFSEDRRLSAPYGIRFNLFEEFEDPAVFWGFIETSYERNAGETVLLTGNLMDDTGGTFTIVMHREFMGVQIYSSTGNFSIFPNEFNPEDQMDADDYTVSEEDPQGRFLCGVDEYWPPDSGKSAEEDSSVTEPPALGQERAIPEQAMVITEIESEQGEKREEPETEEEHFRLVEDGTRVDVLIVYTDNASAAVGGPAKMELAMYEMEAFLNQAFINSLPDVSPPLQAKFVAIVQVPNSVGGSLGNLAASTRVRELRNIHSADLVVLIQTGGTYAGVAFPMCDLNSPTFYRDRAFAIVRSDYIRTFKTVAHEIGHLFGCQHDPNNVDSCSLYSNSRGHYFNARDQQGVLRLYGTIMSYPAAGNRVPHYSNPNVFFRGVATGTPLRFNARAIKDSRTQLSNYRIREEPTPGGGGPTIEITAPPDGQIAAPNSTVSISVKITDTDGVKSARLYWQRHQIYLDCSQSGSWWSCSQAGDVYTWRILLGADVGARYYHVHATDNTDKVNISPTRSIMVGY